jgi:hypothetical protein
MMHISVRKFNYELQKWKNKNGAACMSVPTRPVFDQTQGISDAFKLGRWQSAKPHGLQDRPGPSQG